MFTLFNTTEILTLHNHKLLVLVRCILAKINTINTVQGREQSARLCNNVLSHTLKKCNSWIVEVFSTN